MTKNSLKTLQSKIIVQADSGLGWLTIVDPDTHQEWLVPKAPFVRWALNGTPAGIMNLLPEWNNVCPLGLKAYNDNRDHSDWWVGGGFSMDEYHFSKIAPWDAAAVEKKYELQKELLGFQIVSLSNPKRVKTVSGKAKQIKPHEKAGAGNIAIIPHAGPDYEAAVFEAAKNNSAVITATGGRVAHLAIVSREAGALLIMWPDCLKLRDGDNLTINPTQRTLTIC